MAGGSVVTCRPQRSTDESVKPQFPRHERHLNPTLDVFSERVLGNFVATAVTLSFNTEVVGLCDTIPQRENVPEDVHIRLKRSLRVTIALTREPLRSCESERTCLSNAIVILDASGSNPTIKRLLSVSRTSSRMRGSSRQISAYC